MCVGAVEIADEFLWPMALLAGLLRGPQIFHRRWDRAFVSARERAVELIHAIDFGFHERRSAGSDIAIRALDARVRRIQVGRVFRLLRCETSLTAKHHLLSI